MARDSLVPGAAPPHPVPTTLPCLEPHLSPAVLLATALSPEPLDPPCPTSLSIEYMIADSPVSAINVSWSPKPIDLFLALAQQDLPRTVLSH